LGAVYATFLYKNYNVWKMGFIFYTFRGLVYERRGREPWAEGKRKFINVATRISQINFIKKS
jgi:hypothetical protein